MGFELRFEIGKEVREKVEIKDLFPILLISISAIAVYLSPEKFQDMLALSYENPQFLQMFTSIFVHAGLDHLVSNLIAFVLFATLSLILLSLAGRKEKFHFYFYLFVLLFPFILSSLNLYFIDAKVGRGLSGIVASFIGLTPIAVYLFLRNKIKKDLKNTFPVALFLLASSSITFLVMDSVITKLLVTLFISFLSVLLLWYSIGDLELSRLKAKILQDKKKQNYLLLALSSFLIFMLGVFILFPSDLSYGNGFVNILSHYSGLCLGFLSSYCITSIQEKRGKKM